jgi:hypothetical protein
MINTLLKIIEQCLDDRRRQTRSLAWSVIPAEAGIQAGFGFELKRTWMPVFTGMTSFHVA